MSAEPVDEWQVVSVDRTERGTTVGLMKDLGQVVLVGTVNTQRAFVMAVAWIKDGGEYGPLCEDILDEFRLKELWRKAEDVEDAVDSTHNVVPIR